MWLRRTRSKFRYQHNNSPTFSCTSFKDIQSLCAEDNESNNNSNSVYSNIPDSPASPRKTSHVFHRIRRANSVLRALSCELKIENHETNSKQPVNSSLNGDNKGVVILEKQESIQKPTTPGEADANANPNIGKIDDGEVPIELPGTEKRIVIYFTSLRVVRSTFEACKSVRSILHSFPVAIDERDLSMDGRFMEELQRILGQNEKSKLALPRVFIGGRYIGGAEAISKLHEAGELKKYLEGLNPAPPGTCEVCGGYGFILCQECNGSHKCFVEKGGFRTCTACNENGLVRCPSCSSAPL